MGFIVMVLAGLLGIMLFIFGAKPETREGFLLAPKNLQNQTPPEIYYK